jgi:hypothetical protein
MATVDSIAKSLRQQELDQTRSSASDALNGDKPELAHEGRHSGSFANVMREAFEAAIRMRQRTTNIR